MNHKLSQNHFLGGKHSQSRGKVLRLDPEIVNNVMMSLDRRGVLSLKHFLYMCTETHNTFYSSAVTVGHRQEVGQIQTWYQVKDHKNCHFDPIHFTFSAGRLNRKVPQVEPTVTQGNYIVSCCKIGGFCSNFLLKKPLCFLGGIDYKRYLKYIYTYISAKDATLQTLD